MQQSDHPGLPLDERADRRALILADEEIAFRKTEALAREGRVWLRSPGVMSLTGECQMHQRLWFWHPLPPNQAALAEHLLDTQPAQLCGHQRGQSVKKHTGGALTTHHWYGRA